MAFTYLQTISIFEQYIRPEVEYDYEDYVSSDLSLDFSLIFNLTQSLMLKFSVTIGELEGKFAYEFMKLQNITAFCENSDGNQNFSLIPTTATIDMASGICLHFPFEQFQYRSTDDFCSISVENWITDDPIYDFSIKSYNSYAYNDGTVVPFQQNKRLDVNFGYSAVYQYIRNCTNEYTSPLDCLKNCRNEVIKNLCGNCTFAPNTTIQLKNSAFSHCTWLEYSTCLLSAQIADICNKKCQYFPCTRQLYRFDTIIAEDHSCQRQDLLFFQQMTIHIRDFSYPLMQEQLILSQSDFLANSGGLLGFWLGLDCTFFVSLVMVPLMFLAALLSKKRIPDGTDQNLKREGHFLLFTFSQILGVGGVYKLSKKFYNIANTFTKNFRTNCLDN